MAGFYPSTFVYSHFLTEIEFLYCLLSSLALWDDPVVFTKVVEMSANWRTSL